MKVAVCFSGHMRKWEDTYASWEQWVFEPFTPDIFIDTWDNRGIFVLKDGKVTGHTEVGTLHPDDALVDFEAVQKRYRPIRLTHEPFLPKIQEFSELTRPWYDWRDTLPDWRYTRPLDFVSFSYKIKKANDLKKEWEKACGFKYDVVLRARTDLALHHSLPMECFTDLSVMYTQDGPPEDALVFPRPKSIKQELVIGNSTNMDLYGDLYDALVSNELFEQAKRENRPELLLNQHTATWWWFDKFGLHHRLLPYSLLHIHR